MHFMWLFGISEPSTVMRTRDYNNSNESHSPKLTAKAPEKDAISTRKCLSSNHPFSGAMLVWGRIIIVVSITDKINSAGKKTPYTLSSIESFSSSILSVYHHFVSFVNLFFPHENGTFHLRIAVATNKRLPVIRQWFWFLPRKNKLVGGFKPIEKSSSIWVHLPQFSGWKIEKNTWNHHPETHRNFSARGLVPGILEEFLQLESNVEGIGFGWWWYS